MLAALFFDQPVVEEEGVVAVEDEIFGHVQNGNTAGNQRADPEECAHDAAFRVPCDPGGALVQIVDPAINDVLYYALSPFMMTTSLPSNNILMNLVYGFFNLQSMHVHTQQSLTSRAFDIQQPNKTRVCTVRLTGQSFVTGNFCQI